MSDRVSPAGTSVWRLMAGSLVVAALFAIAWSWSLSGPLTGAVVTQQTDNLTAVAQSAALVVAGSAEPPARIAQQLVARTDMRLTIVAADGTVIADSDRDPATMDNHARREEIADALAGKVGVSRRVSRTEQDEQLYVAVPGTLDGARVAVRVSQPLDDIAKIAAGLRRTGLALLALALAVALGLAVVIARRGARPIRDLSTAAERMAAGDLATPVPATPRDLEALGKSLGRLRDQMRARIDALDAERQSLRTALDGLGDAVVVIEDNRVALANSTAEALFGADAMRIGAALSDALPASVAGEMAARLAAGDTAPAELPTDPTGRTLRLRVSPLTTGGAGPERVIVVVSDVTDAARLDAVRRDFVANASHELKTPVAGIKLLADAARTAASDGDDTQAIAFATQIAQETDRLQRLVSELLDLSRLESAPRPDSITDVRTSIDNTLLAHRAAAQRKELVLKGDLSAVSDIDVYMAADPTDVAVALDNLIDNAIAYTETGSVTVSVAVDADDVLIRVADTGHGIPATDLPRIFERFFRVDRARTREGGGTGLGLALVRHVAQRNGGSVTAESRPGTGSTFTLRLPRAR